jgi:FdhD protein
MMKGCPDEYPITLIINGYEMAVFQLTNQDLKDWVYGYLFSEGLIDRAEDVINVDIKYDFGTIRVELGCGFDEEKMLGKKKHYTAGCGRGVTFFSMTDVKQFTKVKSSRKATMTYLLKKRSEFAQNSPMYVESGGMHGACIVEPDGTITVREDIGRHNAVDKIIGYALRHNKKPEELILLTTGRVSYEMLSKAAKFGIGIIGSRTAATKQAIQLAKYLQIEVIGYLRGKMAIIYTSESRVENDLREFAVAENI